jgi:hypothetical protein
MFKFIFKIIPKYVINKYFEIVFLVTKLLWNFFNVAFKQWLQA